MDLVRLNAVQPALVPPLASGFKVVDLEKDLAGRLMQFQRDALVRVGGVPQSLGAPDRRSRIISTDPDHVFHSRVVQLPGTLKNMITATFERLISEWIGQPVVYSAGFGARTYLRNATFAAHVDRYDTHVASAIIQVRSPPTPVPPARAKHFHKTLWASGVSQLDQQVEQDWPVVICDHEGQAHSVALKAGQALLYESARLLHSRPHPLQGDYYANFFIHFRPKHWEGYLKVRRPYLSQAARQLDPPAR